ncbi:MAG: metallophosphoesterase [Candidatus Aenigmarchaeota archaeon]|nr:metallophosphoesterase [Candidatus Aenigmarchaeota archaeon]MDW8149299.1 metallophosphoesterase [Candidatus Aenigmarchaeota archaeon]
MFKIILNKSAIFIPKILSIVITDIHIGIEKEYGINIVANINKMVENILEIKNSTKAENLIILGDVKHEILKKEKYINYFFDKIENSFDKIIVCKGNHDALIEKHIKFKNIKIKGARGFVIKNIGFFHGHANPSISVKKCRKIFLGHFQPAIKIGEKIEKCFLISRKFVILPSFNPITGYFNVREVNLPSFMKKTKLKFKIYLLNGTLLEEDLYL